MMRRERQGGRVGQIIPEGQHSQGGASAVVQRIPLVDALLTSGNASKKGIKASSWPTGTPIR